MKRLIMIFFCLVAMISANAQTDDLYERQNDLIETASKLSKNNNKWPLSDYNGVWYCSEYDTTIEISFPTQITITKNGETFHIICEKKTFLPDYYYSVKFKMPIFGDYEISLGVKITQFKEDLIVLDVKEKLVYTGHKISESYKLIKQ